MCSYKLVTVTFDMWGLQSRVEHFVHKVSIIHIVLEVIPYSKSEELFEHLPPNNLTVECLK